MSDLNQFLKQFESVSTTVLTGDCRQSTSYVSNKFRGASTGILTGDCRQALSCTSTTLPNGIDTEGRPIAAIDWSRFEVIINVKGKSVDTRFKNLAEAAPYYKGYVWVIESTADSFELQNRKDDINAIRENNIRAYCFNPKYTSRYRIKWGDAKSDEVDSEVIYRIFTETKLTCVSFKELVEKDELRNDIQKSIIKDRQFDGEVSVKTAEKYLPSFRNVPENLYDFLYEPNKSKNPKNRVPKKQIGKLLMAAEKVREQGLGWRTFRKQIGNYGQGYGCMIRSEYYHWLIRIITNARLKKAGIKKETIDSHIDPKTKEERKVHIPTDEENKIRKQVMKEMSLVLKWLWKLTK